MPPAMLTPGQLGWARFAVTLVLSLPALWYVQAIFTNQLGANPVEALVRGLGDWALRMLLVALAVTPLRRLTGWAWLTRLRRRVGLIAYAYVLLHLFAYIGLDQFFDWPHILGEIIKRNFILVGMVSTLMLTALAVTSTNAMIRRLGRRWKPVHRLVYPAALLGVVHYYMMVKADTVPPLWHGAVLLGLLALRIETRWWLPVIRVIRPAPR